MCIRQNIIKIILVFIILMFFYLYGELNNNKQHCYYIESTCFLQDLTNDDIKFLYKILKIKLKDPNLPDLPYSMCKEVGYHMNYKSPWCSNVLSIFNKNGYTKFKRIERTTLISNNIFDESLLDPKLHKVYEIQPNSFDVNVDRVFNEVIPVSKLEEYAVNNNLALDKSDIAYYTNLFGCILERDPTTMEIVDLAQCNSEHSRHWFFNGIMNINGVRETKTLMDYIKEPLEYNKNNSALAFKDNASAIKTDAPVIDLLPEKPNESSPYVMKEMTYLPTLNAETHNFPTGISPFPGAATGVGGRLRDTHAIGRGGIISAGIAGYCVGNLFMEEDLHDWESTERSYQKINGAKMLLEASDGASDYANNFGEPLIAGFCRSFGMEVTYWTLENSVRGVEKQQFEYIKPIMYSAGIGKVPAESLYKQEGEPGMLIYKIGGPAYRIGIGGGSASSRPQDAKIDDLNSVQRGDPEMENRMNRLVRACAEMGSENPIVKIHDQGAGGMANVTKEIIEPLGCDVNIDNVIVGDETLTEFEIWNAEYQEQSTILIRKESEELIQQIAKRENVPISCIGKLNESDKIRVIDNNNILHVDLNLSEILTNKRKKEYFIKDRREIFSELLIPTRRIQNIEFKNDLKKIFSLVSVGSKSFLTLKADRTVGGLVVQQQCVGPLDIPLCDYGMTKHSFYTDQGTITAVGEQPIKGIIDPKAMVGLSIGEMLTNIIWGVVPNIQNIKCSGNWMWPNCDPYEQFKLYECVKEVSRILQLLGIAIDGGKDSLSMTVKTEDKKTIKSPRSFVITGYAEVFNYHNRVTPDLKYENSTLLYINLSNSNFRLGGSAWAQTQNCLGNRFQIPKFENKMIELFPLVFKEIQHLISNHVIKSGHDVSDGGLITTILEMCFSGNYGCELDISAESSLYEFMFSEELGLVIEIGHENVHYVMNVLENIVPVYILGHVVDNDNVTIRYNQEIVLDSKMTELRESWESTSLKLIKRQYGELYANTYRNKIISYEHQRYEHSFLYNMNNLSFGYRPPVAILRDEGTTGDREMAAAFYTAGFQPWDVTREEYNMMYEEIKFPITAICGGFTYSDVLGGGTGLRTGLDVKGLKLGICNGCQMELDMDVNQSGRLESDMVWVNGDNAKLFTIRGRHKCITVNKKGIVKETGVLLWADNKCVGKEKHDGLFLMPHIERMITHNELESGWIEIFLNFHKLIKKN